MENNHLPRLPRPTQADYEKLLQLEQNDDSDDEYLDWHNRFDWSAEVFEENGKHGLKSALGELLLPAVYDDFMMLTSESLNKGDLVVTQQDGLWGVIVADGKGTWLVEPIYNYIGYPNPITNVCKGKKWGVLNIVTGEFVIPLECDMVHAHSGFMFMAGIGSYEKDGKIGIVREDGSFTDAIFEDVNIDLEDLVRVKLDGQWGFINEQGAFTTDEDDDVWVPYMD